MSDLTGLLCTKTSTKKHYKAILLVDIFKTITIGKMVIITLKAIRYLEQVQREIHLFMACKPSSWAQVRFTGEIQYPEHIYVYDYLYTHMCD